MQTSKSGFDPIQFTQSPLKTDGWIKFTNPPEEVFKVVSDHEGMKVLLPLVKEITVSNPPDIQPGESGIGTARTLEFQGGIKVVETIVFWKPPFGYAYSATGNVFPLQNYIGYMGIEPADGGGGTFIFREYYDVKGKLQNTVIPHGVVLAMKQAFGKLSKLIGGTEFDVREASSDA